MPVYPQGSKIFLPSETKIFIRLLKYGKFSILFLYSFIDVSICCRFMHPCDEDRSIVLVTVPLVPTALVLNHSFFTMELLYVLLGLGSCLYRGKLFFIYCYLRFTYSDQATRERVRE